MTVVVPEASMGPAKAVNSAAGAKAQFLCGANGTSKLVPCYVSSPLRSRVSQVPASAELITNIANCCSSLPPQIEIMALEVEQKSFLVVSAEAAGNADVAIVTISGSIHADTHCVRSCANGQRDGDRTAAP